MKSNLPLFFVLLNIQFALSLSGPNDAPARTAVNSLCKEGSIAERVACLQKLVVAKRTALAHSVSLIEHQFLELEEALEDLSHSAKEIHHDPILPGPPGTDASGTKCTCNFECPATAHTPKGSAIDAGPQPAADQVQQPDSVSGSHSSSRSNSEGTSVVTVASAAWPLIRGQVATWDESFELLSAVAVDADVSCLHMLPQGGGEDDSNRLVAVGTVVGSLRVFRPTGELQVAHPGGSLTAVTSMLAFMVSQVESRLVVGHADGSLFMYTFTDTGDWEAPATGVGLTLLKHQKLHPATDAAPHGSAVLPQLAVDSMDQPTQPPIPSQDPLTLTENGQPDGHSHMEQREEAPRVLVSTSAPITSLAVYRNGPGSWRLVAGDAEGLLRMFTEQGTLVGSVQAPLPPLAFLPSADPERALFLTEMNVGSLDIASLALRHAPCQGLNESRRAMSFAFDATSSMQAHGMSEDGSVFTVQLSGDTLVFSCAVKSRRRQKHRPPPVAPLVMQALPHYLVTASADGSVVLFNTTVVPRTRRREPITGARFLFSSSANEIAASLHLPPALGGAGEERGRAGVAVAVGREGVVALSLPGPVVAVFKSKLPVRKPVPFNTSMWTSPVLLSIMLVVGIWQFSKQRNEFAGGKWSHLHESLARVGGGAEDSGGQIRAATAGQARMTPGGQLGSGGVRRVVGDIQGFGLDRRLEFPRDDILRRSAAGTDMKTEGGGGRGAYSRG